MTGALQEDVGWVGIGPAVCMTLDGTYDPPEEVDEYTKKLIKQFRQNRKATEHDPLYKITPEEWKSFCKGATERTSCGCYILHFGTWKAGSFSGATTGLDALLTYIPLQTGYSPLRWRVAINALLLKKAGVTLVEKLRTIVLFQGDFNYLNKYIGRHMMKDGEAYKHLLWEQYGSREGKKAIDQALNKVLSFDLIRQARMDADMCSNDAKSCFDRIVHSIASIFIQQENVPASACICVFTALHNLHHTVRTIYGDSESGYGGTLWTVPYSGVGQGNGAGPAIWAVVSTLVLKMSNDEGFGFMYKTRIEGKQLHFVGYRFVDDTDIIQSGQPGEPFQVLSMRIQAAMDTWEGGLRATGGALEPEKSFWYLIRFFWKNGQWAYVSNEYTPASISVRNHAGNRVELERLEVTESRKTLGVKTAPTGDNAAQFEHMLEASQKLAAQIKASNLRQMDAWLALRSTIWKTLEYPLTCTTLTEKQCEQIMRPAMSAGLTKSHICRSFPTSLLHAGAEAEASGAGLPHLFAVQGIARLSILVSHSPEGSITSLLLWAAMEAALQEAGCGPSPWHP
jgi:hypothetical protein